jgi:hypothetical protein
MGLGHADGLRRIAEEGEGPDPSAAHRFVEAVLALSGSRDPKTSPRASRAA